MGSDPAFDMKAMGWAALGSVKGIPSVFAMPTVW